MLSHSKQSYKYLVYFFTAFIACYLTQEILLNRLIEIGVGTMTGGAFIYFTSPVISDVVAEVYGYRVARQMLWCGLFATLFMAISIFIVLRAPYPSDWKNIVDAYNLALTPINKVALISAACIFIGQIINAYLITKWKILTRGKYFWLRSVGSSMIGDTITVSTSTILIFWGTFTEKMFVSVIGTNLLAMLLCSFIGSFLAMFLVKILNKSENLNNYDTNINFNPFKISTSD